MRTNVGLGPQAINFARAEAVRVRGVVQTAVTIEASSYLPQLSSTGFGVVSPKAPFMKTTAANRIKLSH